MLLLAGLFAVGIVIKRKTNKTATEVAHRRRPVGRRSAPDDHRNVLPVPLDAYRIEIQRFSRPTTTIPYAATAGSPETRALRLSNDARRQRPHPAVHSARSQAVPHASARARKPAGARQFPRRAQRPPSHCVTTQSCSHWVTAPQATRRRNGRSLHSNECGSDGHSSPAVASRSGDLLPGSHRAGPSNDSLIPPITFTP